MFIHILVHFAQQPPERSAAEMRERNKRFRFLYHFLDGDVGVWSAEFELINCTSSVCEESTP